jgi:hypothetical protein
MTVGAALVALGDPIASAILFIAGAAGLVVSPAARRRAAAERMGT